MRKMNWVIGSVGMGLGMMIGILGFALIVNPASSNVLFTKFQGNSNVQSTDKTSQSEMSGQEDALTSKMAFRDNEGVLSLSNQVAADEAEKIDDNDPVVGKEDGQTGQNEVTAQLAEQITDDYKQDIAAFFDAWKLPNMDDFRAKLGEAYTGDLLEKHARRAENYIVQGIGIYASEISFDNIRVEKANDSTATIWADYRYKARDFSFEDDAPFGEEHEQSVHARVNLIKVDSRWLITGETILE